MPPITAELLLKRTEHRFADENNPLALQEVEEIALHQQHIKKIENVKIYMPNLKQLLLHNNDIRHIENLDRLPLTYLNLSLNKVTRLQNLAKLEALEKLDLTLNYVYLLSDIKGLGGCTRARSEPDLPVLRRLYLTGNPVTEFSTPGLPDGEAYRLWTIATVPQLRYLDGEEIRPSDRTKAAVHLPELEKAAREHDERATVPELPEDDEERDEGPKVPNNRKARKDKIASITKQYEVEQEGPATAADGRRLQRNDAGWEWEFEESHVDQSVSLSVWVSRNIGQADIDIDSDVGDVVITTKAGGKEYQLILNLPCEVQPDRCEAVRVSTTGRLSLTWPVADGIVIPAPPTKTEVRRVADEPEQIDDDEGFDDMPELI